MNSYFNSKMYLFNKILSKKRSIICDKSIKEFSKLKAIARRKKLYLIDIKDIKEKLTNNKDLCLNEFQLKNLSMAIIAAKLCKVPENKIFNSLNKINDVNGRLELVRIFSNNIKVFVDYAHTPMRLLNQ